jgi:hypothetical protein
MPSTKTIIRLTIILALLVAVFFAYRFFLNKYRGEETAGLTRETPQEETVGSDAVQGFLDILLTLQKIELRDDFFQSAFFKGLVDFSPDLATQTPGRPNPFAAPLSGE